MGRTALISQTCLGFRSEESQSLPERRAAPVPSPASDKLDFNPQISLQQNRYLNSSETFLLEDSVVVPFLIISSSSSEASTCINVWDFRQKL